MKLLAAYLLATLGGNKDPSADDVKKILSAVGAEADDAQLAKVVSELKGKSIDELITSATGSEKLAAVPTGGGGGAAAAPAAGGSAPAAAAAPEPEPEPEEESDEEMGFGLFD